MVKGLLKVFLGGNRVVTHKSHNIIKWEGVWCLHLTSSPNENSVQWSPLKVKSEGHSGQVPPPTSGGTEKIKTNC